MNLAPIVLFVYNRPWHTVQTLNALSANDLASESILYVFADGPKANTSVEQLKIIEQVSLIIKSETRFKQVILKEGNINLGLANSIISGVTSVINRHRKVIVIEDDMVTSPAFLKYMNESLEKFELCESIGSINSYIDLPINFSKLPPYFLLNGADCWGWATWENRWKDFMHDAGEIKLQLINDKKLKEFDYGNTIPMLDAQINGAIDSWHIRWHGTQILKNKLGVFPNRAFLTNIGLDGTGTHGDFSLDYNQSNATDLNLNVPSILDFDLQSLLKNQKKKEARFKKLLFKQFKVSILMRLKNKIIIGAK